MGIGCICALLISPGLTKDQIKCSASLDFDIPLPPMEEKMPFALVYLALFDMKDQLLCSCFLIANSEAGEEYCGCSQSLLYRVSSLIRGITGAVLIQVGTALRNWLLVLGSLCFVHSSFFTQKDFSQHWRHEHFSIIKFWLHFPHLERKGCRIMLDLQLLHIPLISHIVQKTLLSQSIAYSALQPCREHQLSR